MTTEDLHTVMARHMRFDSRQRPMLQEMSEHTSVSYDVVSRIWKLDGPVTSFEAADKITAALGEFQAFDLDCPLFRSPYMSDERYFAVMKERGCTRSWAKSMPKVKL